ncbi:MAG: phosphocholine cytidylyltransferase family protein [Pseudomonadota bacterium]
MDIPSRPTTALILAAGLGSRLGEVSGGRPKGLCRIGGATLMERSLRTLGAAGFTDIVLITGFAADAYRAFLAAQFPSVRIVHNPHYMHTGSMHSLYLAREEMPADFLLVESDLLYEARALSTLVVEPRSDILLLSGPTGQGDEVYAYGHGSRLRHLSKVRQPGVEALGEFVGISRFSRSLLDELSARHRSRPDFPSPQSYDDAVSELAAVRPIGVHTVPDLIWAEIDDPGQYARAHSQVLPALDSLAPGSASSTLHVAAS